MLYPLSYEGMRCWAQVRRLLYDNDHRCARQSWHATNDDHDKDKKMSDMMNGSVFEPDRPCGSARASELVSIERMSYGSAAVGRLSDGKTVFVEGAAPGDVVEVEVVEDKRTYARGRISCIVEASPQRADMVKCSEACGGCPWAHLSYEAQLASKRDAVIDALCRVARFDRARAVDVVAPCVASKRQWGYRNKPRNGGGEGFRRAFHPRFLSRGNP